MTIKLTMGNIQQYWEDNLVAKAADWKSGTGATKDWRNCSADTAHSNGGKGSTFTIFLLINQSEGGNNGEKKTESLTCRG